MKVLLGLAKSIFEEQTSLQKLVQTMMTHARYYLQCHRIALYVFSLSEASVNIIAKSTSSCCCFEQLPLLTPTFPQLHFNS